MRKYETMVILNATLDAEARNAVLESLKGILTDNGATVTNVNEWGMREFAYEIDKQMRGYYVVIDFETENNACNAEFERLCKINTSIVREIVVAKPE